MPLTAYETAPGGEALDLRTEDIRVTRERQAARNAHGLLNLLREREELRGVSALADHLVDRVLWCA
jgi:hypothetical protein